MRGKEKIKDKRFFRGFLLIERMRIWSRTSEGRERAEKGWNTCAAFYISGSA